ncbi:hypothetical protein MXB_73 [Myxobolus squamalis]|nr:hypothetical protein MXB_73 [Myxobolus squamalis]
MDDYPQGSNTILIDEDAELDTPLTVIQPDQVEVYRSSTFSQVLIHLFKSNVGVGLLNMPQNISRAGILVGPLFSILLIFPVIHCIFLLLKCSRELKKRSGKRVIGYAGTFRYSLIEHFPSGSRYAAYITNFYLVTTQLGICTAYIIFTAETFQENTRVYMAIISGSLIPFVLVTRLDVMSILSGSANVFCIFSLACTFVYICLDLKDPTSYPLVGEIKKFPIFVSTLMYVYEGINLIIPLDNEIDDPSKYPLAINLSTYGSGLLYFLMGLLGYIAYGNGCKSSVTLNLPFEPFTNIVKMVYALGVIFTFFIQFHVAMRAVLPTLLKRISDPKKKTLYNSALRLVFALITIMFAIAIPQLSNIISLIGALACTSLCFIFPCIIHLATFWNCTSDETRLTQFEIRKDLLIIIFGTISSMSGFYVSINQIYNDYH